MKGRIYIAGPMRGIKDFNFPAFDAAANEHRLDGWDVFSPAERDRALYGEDFFRSDSGDIRDIIGRGFNFREALAADLQWIVLKATAIYMLSGWRNSLGAQAEWAAARTIGIKIDYQD